MMTKISEMREVCQPMCKNEKAKKAAGEHWISGNITRYYSIYITWLLVKLNISANAVTFWMILFGLAGVPLLIPHVLWMNIIGAIALILAEVFDCVDGEVARWTKKSSLKGVYLDLVSHSLCNSMVSSLCALHLYALNRDVKYLIMAFVAYYIAQSRYTLVQEYHIIRSKLPAVESESVQTASSAKLTLSKAIFNISRKIYRRAIDGISIDHVLVRFLSIIAILLGYAGTQLPMMVLSWWFIIAGGLGVVKEVATKYYIHVPDSPHKKV